LQLKPYARISGTHRVELANLAGERLDGVIAAAERGIRRIRASPHLAFWFLRYCGLSLW